MQAQIGVSVLDGVVTLQGAVPDIPPEMAGRTRGAPPGHQCVPSPTIWRSPAPGDGAPMRRSRRRWRTRIERDNEIPTGRVKATVRHGWVTLSGTTTWQFQRSAAESASGLVNGVKGVANSIVDRVAGEHRPRFAVANRSRAAAGRRGAMPTASLLKP